MLSVGSLLSEGVTLSEGWDCSIWGGVMEGGSISVWIMGAIRLMTMPPTTIVISKKPHMTIVRIFFKDIWGTPFNFFHYSAKKTQLQPRESISV
jgi:hypothetical protein